MTTNVIKTRVYGRKPHDEYTVAVTGATEGLLVVTIKEPSLDALGKALGDNFVKQGEIKDTIESLQIASGVSFYEHRKLAFAKDMLINAINAYDTSDAVNAFTLTRGGKSLDYWLPAAKRNQLVGSVTTWSESHEKYTLDLREYGKSVEIECNRLLEVLSALEEYAVKCFNTTTSHLNAINQAETIEDVVNYDYTADYPEQLTFEV